MKFTWFNLMPWPLSAGRFPGEEPLGLGRHRPARCSIPAKSHEVYNTYLDLLEYADHARLRRHRRQRAPPERLWHDAVAQHHGGGAGAPHQERGASSCWATRSRSTIRRCAWPRNSPCWTCISGGRLVAGFPVGTSMDTNYCYGQIPALTREKYHEAHDLIMQGLDGATSRSPSTAATTSCATSTSGRRPIQKPHPPIHIPGGGSVETYDFCIDNTYSYSYLSFSGYIRAKALMQGYWDRVAERNAPTNRPIAPASPRPSAWPKPTRRPSGSTPSTSTTSTTAACTSIRASPTRRATAPSRPSRPARCRNTPRRSGGYAKLTWKDLVERRPRHRRLPGDGAPAHGGPDQGPARRQHLLPDACRRHAGRQVHVFHQAVRREGDAEAAQHVPRLRRRQPLLVPAAGQAGDAGPLPTAPTGAPSDRAREE